MCFLRSIIFIASCQFQMKLGEYTIVTISHFLRFSKIKIPVCCAVLQLICTAQPRMSSGAKAELVPLCNKQKRYRRGLEGLKGGTLLNSRVMQWKYIGRSRNSSTIQSTSLPKLHDLWNTESKRCIWQIWFRILRTRNSDQLKMFYQLISDE